MNHFKGKDVEQRLNFLEQDVANLYKETANVRTEIFDIHCEIQQSLKNEGLLRESGDAAISTTLKEISITGLNITGMGVCFLFCGVIFSFAPQILSWF